VKFREKAPNCSEVIPTWITKRKNLEKITQVYGGFHVGVFLLSSPSITHCKIHIKESTSQPQIPGISKAGHDRKGHRLVPAKNNRTQLTKVTIATIRKITEQT
jgi:hypothetical protein